MNFTGIMNKDNDDVFIKHKPSNVLPNNHFQMEQDSEIGTGIK